MNRGARTVVVSVSVLLLAVVPRMALAQAAWPSKPVRVVVPYSPGGGADAISRIYFGKLAADLGHPFAIDNRGGGAGTIGPSIVAKSAPDGYTILHDATAFSINPSLLPKLPYDSGKEFIPVFLAGVVPNLLVVNPAVPAKNVAEIIALAKATPNGLDWASSGNGSAQHLALEMFKRQAGIRLNHVPYKGGGPAIADLAGGHIRFFFSNAASSTPHVRAGTIRAVAHTGADRLAAFPDLAPVAETLPGFEAYEWNGVFLPAGTPREIVERLSAALNAAQRDAGVQHKLATLSVQSRQNTPAEFAQFVQAQTAQWTRVVREGNIRVE